MEAPGNKSMVLLITLFTFSLLHPVVAWPIGVNYGTVADNLPPPAQVAEFLKTKTSINKIKLFDANPDIIQAFANSGIAVTITVPNGEIPNIVQLPAAQEWVKNHVTPFVPQTNVIRVLVGNEILHWGPQAAIDNLVAAMRTLHQALQLAGHKNIQVSTPHSLGILDKMEFPSAGKFRPGWDTGVLAPMLQFLNETKAPFIVNPYPYFDTNAETVDFCAFRPNKGKFDPVTKINYRNQFDWLMDGTFSAMKALGFTDVEIVAGETGWPTIGEPFQTWVNVDTARNYNSKLVQHVNSGKGTPLMPGRKFEAYIFGLFTENLKPGPVAERNFGLFRPDFTLVYDIGIMKGPAAKPQPQPQPQPAQPKPQPQPAQPKPQPHPEPVPKPAGGTQPHPVKPAEPQPKPVNPAQPGPNPGKQWCVPKPEATDAQLQANLDYTCSQGIDCKPIQAGGPCFAPGNVRALATYAMNAYYQTHGRQPGQCDFSGSGIITTVDPSNGTCKM